MFYAVDFVLDVMKKFSSSNPVLFQRDGSLFVASGQGFGQVTYGLRTRPEKIESWAKREQKPEILESQDVVKEWIGESYSQEPVFMNGEKKYLAALLFGPDNDSFTLEDMAKAAESLSKLPDDGKIRMVQHVTGYHSHKHGYAVDGIDVSVHSARIMDRNRYLELIRNKEEEILQEFEHISPEAERRDIRDSYNRLTFPDCVILTPYMIVSVPRTGRLHSHRSEPDSWTQKYTNLMHRNESSSTGSILYHSRPESFDESPFGVSITLNAQHLKTAAESNKILENIGIELDAVDSFRLDIADIINRMNAVHNKVCAKDIAWKKELRNKK